MYHDERKPTKSYDSTTLAEEKIQLSRLNLAFLTPRPVLDKINIFLLASLRYLGQPHHPKTARGLTSLWLWSRTHRAGQLPCRILKCAHLGFIVAKSVFRSHLQLS